MYFDLSTALASATQPSAIPRECVPLYDVIHKVATATSDFHIHGYSPYTDEVLHLILSQFRVLR